MCGFIKEATLRNRERLLLLIVVTAVDMHFKLGGFLNCWLQVRCNTAVLWGHNNQFCNPGCHHFFYRE